MSSPFRKRAFKLAAVSFGWALLCISPTIAQQTGPQISSSPVHQRELRVCADPDNLPFSNTSQQGFENRLAELIASDLNARLTYVWQRMGRGFVREYINSSRCDLLVGIPTDFKPLLTTEPYYRSTYVFVVRRDAAVKPQNLDDPNLSKIKIAVQALDEQYTPPAEELMKRGLQDSLVPFHTVGKDSEQIIRAVLNHDVDAAMVWGPLAGYWAKQFADELELTAIPQPEPKDQTAAQNSALPMTFAISMGVRKSDAALCSDLENILRRRKNEIQNLLAFYGIPQTEISASPQVGGD